MTISQQDFIDWCQEIIRCLIQHFIICHLLDFDVSDLRMIWNFTVITFLLHYAPSTRKGISPRLFRTKFNFSPRKADVQKQDCYTADITLGALIDHSSPGRPPHTSPREVLSPFFPDGPCIGFSDWPSRPRNNSQILVNEVKKFKCRIIATFFLSIFFAFHISIINNKSKKLPDYLFDFQSALRWRVTFCILHLTTDYSARCALIHKKSTVLLCTK